MRSSSTSMIEVSRHKNKLPQTHKINKNIALDFQYEDEKRKGRGRALRGGGLHQGNTEGVGQEEGGPPREDSAGGDQRQGGHHLQLSHQEHQELSSTKIRLPGKSMEQVNICLTNRKIEPRLKCFVALTSL